MSGAHLLEVIGAADAVGQLTADHRTIERKVLERLTGWRAMLDGDVAERRQFLREVLDGPIRFAPEGKRIGSWEVTPKGA